MEDRFWKVLGLQNTNRLARQMVAELATLLLLVIALAALVLIGNWGAIVLTGIVGIIVLALIWLVL